MPERFDVVEEGTSLLRPADDAPPLPSWIERFRMAGLCCSMCLYGLQHAALGANIQDMAFFTNSSVQSLSAILSVDGIAMAVATFILTIYIDKYKFYLDKALPVCTLVIAILLIITPLSHNTVIVFGFAQLLAELLWTVVLLSIVTITTGVWGKRTPTVMFLHKMSTGIGAAVSVPLSIPFLAHHPRHPPAVNYTLDRSLNPHSECRVQIIYVIIGFIGLIPVTIYCLVLLKVRSIDYPTYNLHEEKKSFWELISPRHWSAGREKFGVCLAIFSVLNFTSLYSVDIAIKVYLVTMVTAEPLELPELRADLMLDVYNVVEIFSCAIFAVATLKVDVLKLVIGQFTLMTNAALLLALLGLNYEIAMWFSISGLALTVAPAYAAFMGWTNQYIILSGLSMGFVNLGRGLGWLIGEGVGGQLVQYGPKAVAFYLLGAMLLSVQLYIPTQVYCSKVGKRVIT